MVLGKLAVLGRPTNLDYSRARAYCAYSRCGWGLFGYLFGSFISLGTGTGWGIHKLLLTFFRSRCKPVISICDYVITSWESVVSDYKSVITDYESVISSCKSVISRLTLLKQFVNM